MGMQSMTGAIDDLQTRGFTANLSVVGNRMRVAGACESFRPADIVVRDYQRFEGVSDPDDMAILYAIETTGGVRGTLSDAYGVYADPLISEFMAGVPITEIPR